MITRKVAPALAAGCPIVVKPSELTPLSALALATLAERAGIPKGVLSVVTGLPQEIGAEMTGNMAVRKLSFTGSTPIGRILMAQCAASVKRVSFELGGNAPLIVFDDADLDTAVAGVLASKFRNAGQTCVCANRILVQAASHDRFAARLAEAVSRHADGQRLRGRRHDRAGHQRSRGRQDRPPPRRCRHQGRRGRDRVGAAERRPLRDADRADRRDRGHADRAEETFGPVAPLFRFEEEEEAIAMANATPFGLASYFFTERHAAILARRGTLEFGMVGSTPA